MSTNLTPEQRAEPMPEATTKPKLRIPVNVLVMESQTDKCYRALCLGMEIYGSGLDTVAAVRHAVEKMFYHFQWAQKRGSADLPIYAIPLRHTMQFASGSDIPLQNNVITVGDVELTITAREYRDA